MHTQHTQQLTPNQIQDIKTLTTACRNFEPLSLSAPLEDGPDYFLLYENEQLISMLFLFFPEETVCECGAFTLPAWRKNGCFSRLWEDAIDYVEALEEKQEIEIDLCILADPRTPSAMAVLEALEAEFWYNEYSMERALSPSDIDVHTSLPIHEAEPNLYTATGQDGIIGTCCLLPSEQTVYLYGFEIKESLRRQGYGREFLVGMLALLAKKEYSTVSLQVSGQNMAAMSLYEKTGFLITDTLSYYFIA